MIQTEKTPNPDSLKFLSDKTISAIGTEEFIKDRDKEIDIPFVRELLNFNGVELILLSEKFLSVKKTKDVSWNELKPMVISHLNDYFEKNNEPILKGNKKTINQDQRKALMNIACNLFLDRSHFFFLNITDEKVFFAISKEEFVEQGKFDLGINNNDIENILYINDEGLISEK